MLYTLTPAIPSSLWHQRIHTESINSENPALTWLRPSVTIAPAAQCGHRLQDKPAYHSLRGIVQALRDLVEQPITHSPSVSPVERLPNPVSLGHVAPVDPTVKHRQVIGPLLVSTLRTQQ